jgi:hypothetical protein
LILILSGIEPGWGSGLAVSGFERTGHALEARPNVADDGCRLCHGNGLFLRLDHGRAIMADDGFGPFGNMILITVGFFASIFVANVHGISMGSLTFATAIGLSGRF